MVGNQGVAGGTARAYGPLHRRNMGIALKKRHLTILDRHFDRTSNCTHPTNTEH